MSGLASFGSALGHFAGGAAQGLERGQLMSVQQQRMGLLDAAEARLRKEDARRDALTADNEAARMEGMDVLKKAQSAYESDWNKQQPGPTEDGGGVATNPMPAWQPDEKTQLRAAEAHANGLLKRGRVDEFAKAWSVAEGRRAQIRGTAAQQLFAAMSAGGGITDPLKAYYGAVDNGFDLDEVQTGQGQDGKPVYSLKLKNRKTGAENVSVVSANQLQTDVANSLANPAEFSKQIFQQKMEDLKRENALAEIKARGTEQRSTDDRKTANDKDLEGLRAKNQSGQIAQTGAEHRKTDAAKEGLGGADGGEIKTLTQANRAVETARVALKDARANSVAIRLKGDRADRMTPDERSSEVDKDVGVKSALARYNEVSRIRDDMAAKKTGLGDAKAPQGLPAGSKQIGTSGGKPVYQSPDGKKFVVD